jgi:hypothetical protein
MTILPFFIDPVYPLLETGIPIRNINIIYTYLIETQKKYSG